MSKIFLLIINFLLVFIIVPGFISDEPPDNSPTAGQMRIGAACDKILSRAKSGVNEHVRPAGRKVRRRVSGVFSGPFFHDTVVPQCGGMPALWKIPFYCALIPVAKVWDLATEHVVPAGKHLAKKGLDKTRKYVVRPDVDGVKNEVKSAGENNNDGVKSKEENAEEKKNVDGVKSKKENIEEKRNIDGVENEAKSAWENKNVDGVKSEEKSAEESDAKIS